MVSFPFLMILLLNIITLLSAPSIGPIRAGHARFTVVAPECLRMEYSPTGVFVDTPSYFAFNRSASYPARVVRNGKVLTIDAGKMTLQYIDDGQPFSSTNLNVVVRDGLRKIVWTPGLKNDANLGGPIPTLDTFDGAGPLDDGVLSRNGWYLLDDSTDALIVEPQEPLPNPPLGTESEGDSHDGTEGGLDLPKPETRPSGAGIDWYWFGYGSDYRGALKSLMAISGSVPLPRRYMLGTWYSRYWPYSSSDYREIVNEYAEHGFPLDNIVMDMDWHNDGWTGWSWNRTLLPDAEDLLKWFHQQGLHVTLNVHPADGVGPKENQYAPFMRDLGLDPSTGSTVPFDAADPKYMTALFRDVHQPLEQEGVDFWWLDWQQSPYTRSVPNLKNLTWLNELYYRETSQGGKRGASFSRWGGWGDQRHPIHFSGDASTHWPMLAFEIAMTEASGNAGCFFWTHDIGGHNRGRNEESYTRWCQFGAMSAALRAHSTRDKTMDRRPWTYPLWAENSMRISERLRSELFPYIYSSAAESSRESVPLLRPLYLAYPTIEDAYHNAQQYLFGDNVLVAPITQPGVGPGRVASQTVWFPDGDWYDWFSGVLHTGRRDELVADGIDEFPLYVRGGVPIPMQPYSPRMASSPLMTTASPDHAQSAVLVVRCYPGRDGQSGATSLYQDDGETTAYRSGAYATTLLSYVRHGNRSTVVIHPSSGEFAGQPQVRGYTVELPDLERPQTAWVDGKRVPCNYEPDMGVVRVTVSQRSIRSAATVVVDAGLHSQRQLVERSALRRVEGVLGDTWGHDKSGSVLSDARMAGLDAAHLSALFAVFGIGLVDHNNGVYDYHGDQQIRLYAPSPADIASASLTVLDGHQTFVAGFPEAKATSPQPSPLKREGESWSCLPPLAGGPRGVSDSNDDRDSPASLDVGRTISPAAHDFSRGSVDYLTAGPQVQPGSLAMGDQPELGFATVIVAGHTYTLQTSPLASLDNIALTADVSASSSQPGYTPQGAIDGIVDGYPGDINREWASNYEKVGAWIKLTWKSPQTIDRVVLYDRPNLDDQVLGGTLTFDDGSSADVGALPNDASSGLTVTFAPKTVTSITFTVTSCASTTVSVGLSEIAVYKARVQLNRPENATL